MVAKYMYIATIVNFPMLVGTLFKHVVYQGLVSLLSSVVLLHVMFCPLFLPPLSTHFLLQRSNRSKCRGHRVGPGGEGERVEEGRGGESQTGVGDKEED